MINNWGLKAYPMPSQQQQQHFRSLFSGIYLPIKNVTDPETISTNAGS
jgi:hypothetical protein